MITEQLQLYNFTVSKTKETERGELLTYFLDRMNPLRKGAGYKEWTIKSIAVHLSLIKTGDLYELKRKCENAKNFGACFNFYVFPKKPVKLAIK